MNSNTSYNLPSLSNEGGLSAYFAQIKKFPMLDAEEEYMLAKNWKETGKCKICRKTCNKSFKISCKNCNGL